MICKLTAGTWGKCSESLITKELRIKAITRYCLTPVKWLLSRRSSQAWYTWEAEAGGFLCFRLVWAVKTLPLNIKKWSEGRIWEGEGRN